MSILRLVKQLPTIAGYTFLPGVQFEYEAAQVRQAGPSVHRHERKNLRGGRFCLSPD